MLNAKTKSFIEKAKELKKSIHRGIMSDSLECMDEYTFNLLQNSMQIIDLSLELVEEQNKTLADIDKKMDKLLGKIEG